MRPTARQLLDVVSQGLHGRAPRPRWTQVLDGNGLHVDHGDDGPVFLVTVEEVPRRRWAPAQPVTLGPVETVTAQLVGVTVDNLVHVHLVAAPPGAHGPLVGEDGGRPPRRAADAGQTTGGPTPDDPEDPALALRRVQVTVADGLGTRYELAAAEYGGTGTESVARQSFTPRPPADAGQLVVSLRIPGGLTVRVPVPLPSR